MAGVRRGTHIAKAMALGACMAGRAYLYGGERFVHFEQRDVADVHAGALGGLADGVGGLLEQRAVVGTSDRAVAEDCRQRLNARASAQARLVTIIADVSRRDRALSAECRAEPSYDDS